MNRVILRRFVPLSAIGGAYILSKASQTASAKTEIVRDEFQTVKFWNEYKKVIVYGYQGCPYCAKGKFDNICFLFDFINCRNLVRAYLSFRGIEFEDVEVNAFSKAELKEVSPGYKQVPVVEIQDNRGQREAGMVLS